MRILVTGGAGFIGSHIVDALVPLRHKVFIIDNLSKGKKENLNPKAEFLNIDITQGHSIKKAFGKMKPEAVFHCAAQIDVRESVANPVRDAEINILGSLNIISAANQANCKKFIFSSSGGALYGDTKNIPTPETHPTEPVSPYGAAKLSVEAYLHYFYAVWHLPYIAVRYANVYGPRQNSQGEAGVVAIFCNRMIRGISPTIYGSGLQTRDYVYVHDVVQANMLALKSLRVGCYNVGTSVETNVNGVARLIQKTTGFQGKILHGPAKRGEQKRSCLDYSKIKKELGWKPKVSFPEGIKKTVEWFKIKS